ncbi:hypothetical protein NGRA_0036 [Nosema granulosis]|uniref:Transmembrane protein n=1 Tax=Nosema granulosis TaxID=83296 RepID=A0A9P6H1N9_9MICR|nr:hypothetical protein NGRA_0036 [Nosema granulosis]
MQKPYYLKKNKRKMTSFWGLALFVVLTSTYFIFVWSAIKGRKEQPDEETTGSVERFDSFNRFWTIVTEDDPRSTIMIQDVTLKERETIFLRIFTYFTKMYTFTFLLMTALFLLFKKSFLHFLPQGCFTYMIFFGITNTFTIYRSVLLLCVSLFINLMVYEQSEYNLDKIVVIFNSYLKMLCKPGVILCGVFFFSFTFIFLQLYMIASIHRYIPNITPVVYPFLIIYFVVSMFTTMLILASFVVSLSFFNILHSENCFSAFFYSCLNVFYNSGEICVYGLQFYRLNFVSVIQDCILIYQSPNLNILFKLVISIIYAICSIFFPFFSLFRIEGFYAITYLTLAGRSYKDALQKINQLTHSIEMIPYFNGKSEYILCLNAISTIFLFKNTVIFNNLVDHIMFNWFDDIVLLCLGLLCILFFTFLFNLLYSNLLFLFILCGDLLKNFDQRLFKILERKRNDLRFNDFFFNEESEEESID